MPLRNVLLLFMFCADLRALNTLLMVEARIGDMAILYGFAVKDRDPWEHVHRPALEVGH